MDTKEELCSTQTHPGITVLACLIGACVGFYCGYHGLVDVALRGSASVMAAVNLALTGAALGASLVGLCALICGAELGVRFSYPLGLSLGGLMGPLACGLLLWGGMRVDGGVFMATWLAGIILLGAFGGKVVATSIRGYHGRSRFWAVVGIISMLLVGWRSMDSLEEGLIRSDEFVVCMLALAICGGSLGAMVGAIIDSLSRRSVRKK